MFTFVENTEESTLHRMCKLWKNTSSEDRIRQLDGNDYLFPGDEESSTLDLYMRVQKKTPKWPLLVLSYATISSD